MSDFLELIFVIFAGVLGLVVAVGLVIGVPLWLFGATNVADLNINAPRYLESMGYTVLGREGFTYGVLSQPGGCVWYSMSRKEQPATLYTGCVSKWRNGTYELWGPKAINAVSAH